MTTEHLDARPLLASALVTAIDHVGVAVPDLDKAVAWYHDFLGMIVVHEEVNADQGVREAMLAVRGAPAGSSQIQLMAPLDDTCTIAKFLDKRGPGIQQLACRVSDIDALSASLRDKGIRLLYDQPRRGTATSSSIATSSTATTWEPRSTRSSRSTMRPAWWGPMTRSSSGMRLKRAAPSCAPTHPASTSRTSRPARLALAGDPSAE